MTLTLSLLRNPVLTTKREKNYHVNLLWPQTPYPSCYFWNGSDLRGRTLLRSIEGPQPQILSEIARHRIEANMKTCGPTGQWLLLAVLSAALCAPSMADPGRSEPEPAEVSTGHKRTTWPNAQERGARLSGRRRNQPNQGTNSSNQTLEVNRFFSLLSERARPP